jgi:outer membrane protein assembly factor BamB
VQNEAPESKSYIRALPPETSDLAWEYLRRSGASLTVAHGGPLSTAGNVVFSGHGEGLFVAVDARSGKELWNLFTFEAVRHDTATATFHVIPK